LGLHALIIPFYIVRLDAEMVNASRARFFRELVVKMDPACADLHEDIACAGDLHIEYDLPSKKGPVKFQALSDIRCKEMYMVDVV